jgi:very-short-patch-repair endonuclease
MIAPVTRNARRLRNAPTEAEQLLWRHLRGKSMAGIKFRRQYPIGPFIADFACIELKLVIEADGGQHLDCEYDVRRDAYLRSRGYRVLRYWNDQILAETAAVLEDIYRWVERGRLSPSQPPPQVGEETIQGAPPQMGEE